MQGDAVESPKILPLSLSKFSLSPSHQCPRGTDAGGAPLVKERGRTRGSRAAPRAGGVPLASAPPGTTPAFKSRLVTFVDSCITQLQAQGPSRTCNERKKQEEEGHNRLRALRACNLSPFHKNEQCVCELQIRVAVCLVWALDCISAPRYDTCLCECVSV